jgi:ubiquinone/menaquinone biosynthesis C-methylase UbiE
MRRLSNTGFVPGGFSNLDAFGEASQYVRYLEHTAARLRNLSRARYELLNLHPGDSVLDVGCGLGEDSRELAPLVSPRGKVVGIDSSAAMIAQARKGSQKFGRALRFAVGDAHNLKFAEAAFTACWSERVLQHLSDPARAISEMVRVTKPGGRIVLFEPDYSTLVIDASDRAITGSIASTLADSIRSPWIGRALLSLLQTSGLQEVTVIPTPLISRSLSNTIKLLRLDVTAKATVRRGLITRDDAKQWFADLRRRDTGGYFFGCLLCFTAVGEKPRSTKGVKSGAE